MQLIPATNGWFATTAATTANTYVADYNTAVTIKPQFLQRPHDPKPEPLSPVEWLRSRVGEYVEAGVLA